VNLKFKKEDSFFGTNKSLLSNYWIKKDIDKRLSLNISQKFSLSDITSNLLASRSIKIDEIKYFLNPTLDFYLPNPSIFNDMENSVNRVFNAIEKKEKIAILGDYDVDGVSSIVLLKKYFEFYGINPFTYIPDRIKEGYGPNKNAIDIIKQEKISLLVMVDCGTNSHEIINYLLEKKIDLIIIDHHKSNEKHSKNICLINPNSILDTSGYGFLCTAGLVYIFLYSLNKLIKSKKKKIIDISNYLDLVALATVCDVVPLININRAFVYQGLKILSKRDNLGLKILSDEGQLNKKPDEEDLGFFFGPRINAGGRVGKPNIGEKLLITNEEYEADLLVKQLNTLNYQRKLIEEKVYEECIIQITRKQMHNKNSLFVYDDHWHEGVIGIVASRLKEKFNKPVIILTKNNNTFKGSGRSIQGIDIGYLILLSKQKNIILNGGGHQMAAGLSISKNKLLLLENFFENFVKKNIRKNKYDNCLIIDQIISIEGINDELIDSINKISPFGIGNPKPKFLLHNVRIIKPTLVGESKNHLSFIITDTTLKTIKAIIFRAADNLLGKTILSNYKKNLFSFTGFVKKSFWKNKTNFEIIIEDGVLGKDII
tara:strand:- start:2967 stop:4760 length:1794 start_codon:yes stop_codon:yes gene_type:complete